MQLPRLLRVPRFWLGFGVGSLVTILSLAVLVSAWVLHAKRQVNERLDRQWAEHKSLTRPLLKVPELAVGEGPDLESEPREPRVDFSQWKLETLDGRGLLGSQLEGRPLFVNFWATWCSPCIAEMPAIVELAASPQASSFDLQVLLVTDETKEDVERFLAKRPELRGLSFALAHDGIPAEIWFHARPATSIVGCDGEVILRHTGAADWSAPSFRSSLGEALRQSCG